MKQPLIELKRGMMKKYVFFLSCSVDLAVHLLHDVLKVPHFVSFVLLSHCVTPNLVDLRICQKFYPNKAFWNDVMIWGKTAVVCAFEEEIHQQSPSWKFAR